jgi:hypothetical protein
LFCFSEIINIPLLKLKEMGCTANELHENGFELQDLKEIGFTVNELYESGFELQDLNEIGFLFERRM